jgi:predicted nucleic acid-binding protein
MGLLIDTNVFIAAERSRQEGTLERLLEQIPRERAGEDVLISVITASELELGVQRADSVPRRERRHAFVEAIFAQFGTAPIDLLVARRHAQLVAELMTAGHTIGTHDSWIAATGIALGHAIVTANSDEFQRVPGLAVVPVQLQL